MFVDVAFLHESAAQANTITAMKEIVERGGYDKGTDHADADDILLALLRSLGDKELVRQYEKLEKWYA